MEPSVVVENARVFLGDCREVLKTLPDNSVDSVVTDPPYELGFMGKKWDSSGIAYDVTVWEECLRVLKPGGHILAFGGTRTWHRLAVAVEDAGFEIRDNIAWMYGSGFPKSLDVSKAIDKSDAKVERRARDLRFTSWMRSTGMTAKQINQLTNSVMGSHYLTNKEQPAVPTEDMFTLLRPYLPDVPEDIERLVFERTVESKNFAEREVIGQGADYGHAVEKEIEQKFGFKADYDITAPATSEAQKWQGWGTALKPAFEPVVVGRKPIQGTVASNVLEWGVGGLNIDGSRIGTTETLGRAKGGWGNAAVGADNYGNFNSIGVTVEGGRWPANVILDEVTAGLLDEQTADLKGATSRTHRPNRSPFTTGTEEPVSHEVYADSGGASRFFYVAKASKRDRNEGLEDPNGHPTVKPTTLMRYLIKLVTPPGGTVLDPFTGSGSTGKAALLDGFEFIGAELTEDYLPIIEGRLKWAVENREEESLF